MDERAFDRCIKQLSGQMPRRGAPLALAGVVAGVMALRRGETRAGAGCKKLNRHCRKDRECCTGQCRRGKCRRGGRG